MAKKYLIIAHNNKKYKLLCKDLKTIIYKTISKFPTIPLFNEKVAN